MQGLLAAAQATAEHKGVVIYSVARQLKTWAAASEFLQAAEQPYEVVQPGKMPGPVHAYAYYPA
jgi:hypothetical protein